MIFFILMQIKLFFFTRKVFYLTSFWKWEILELGNCLSHARIFKSVTVLLCLCFKYFLLLVRFASPIYIICLIHSCETFLSWQLIVRFTTSSLFILKLAPHWPAANKTLDKISVKPPQLFNMHTNFEAVHIHNLYEIFWHCYMHNKCMRLYGNLTTVFF